MLPKLERLASLWRARVDRPYRLGAFAAIAALVLALAHLARLGTVPARAGAAAAIGLCLCAFLVHAFVTRRAWKRPALVVSRTIGSADRELGERTLRALVLASRAAHDEAVGSSELAWLHLHRLLDRTDEAHVAARAGVIGRRLQWAALAAVAVGFAAVAAGPFRVIEGLDVLLARKAQAPFAMEWLDGRAVESHPPDYLHERDTMFDPIDPLAVPVGSLLTIRGAALHPGRHLILSDGSREVPFVDDASGGVVARWPVSGSVRLNVAARFGGVLVREPVPIEVTAVPDLPPKVVLEGAPRVVKLLEEPEISLSYNVEDDHGLREVQLVLRSGDREERRVLAHLDGETKHDRGAYRLRSNASFFKRTYAAVEVTVEARDNDPVTGPKWGKSEIITVIPPSIGEPEAMRYEALSRIRDESVDLLADRMDHGVGKSSEERKSHGDHERDQMDAFEREAESALSGSYGGLRIPARAATVARGQLRKLREAGEKEVRRPSEASHSVNRTATEDAAIAFDGTARHMGTADVIAVAKRASTVADDAGDSAAQAKGGQEREHSAQRFDAAATVLESAGTNLSRLGPLGTDLGEIVQNDLKRMRRARGAADWGHAELAARDLAARLRRPSPSFGGGRRGGVESGRGNGGSKSPDEEGDGSGDAVAREQQEMEDLARDHAAQVSSVERALGQAGDPKELEALRNEARQHAEAVRQAIRELPNSGGEPRSAEAEAATGREYGEAMAQELEQGDPRGAVQSGKSALDALERAQHEPADPWSGLSGQNASEQARRAGGRLEQEVAWAEKALERLQKAQSAGADDELGHAAPRESQLAERAQSLAQEGKSGSGALPGTTLELLEQAAASMHDASKALGTGEGNRGLERQRDAQRLLEMARSAGEQDESQGDQQGNGQGGQGDPGDDGEFAQHAPIPKAEDYRGPESFRRRVLEGLRGPVDPRLRDAVKRYAEGLLR